MKKKKIKINFKYFWEGFDPNNNFFTNILKKKYDVIISDNPDYLFYSVYPEIQKKTKTYGQNGIYEKGEFIRKISPNFYVFLRKIYSLISKTFSKKPKMSPPKGDFVKIFYGAEKTKPNMQECDFAFSVFFEEEINHPNYMRIPTHIITDFTLDKKQRLPLKRRIDFKKIKSEKNKFCNFIYAQDKSIRNNFFKKLSQYKKIDAPGRCMNNMPPIGKHENAKKSRISIKWAKEKLDFLKDYKFTIAFENEVLDGYTTEKLVHPLLVNSLPIYFGNKLVGRDFNEKCFINFNNFKDMEALVKHVINVDKDEQLYKGYLEQPIFKNKEQYEFSREERVLKKLKEIIESKKAKNPKISVIMPVYNSEKFLDESISSILNQSFKDFELIIINDKSTDFSLKIIKKYMRKDKRIKLVNNEKNLGTVRSRNIGLKNAEGKYVAILDSDDISNSERLRLQYSYLEKNPHIFLVGSSAVYINEQGEELCRFRKYNNYKILRWRLPKSCSIVHSSIMFRNEKNNFYNEDFKSAHDYNFYLDLLANGKNITNLPVFLVKHRFYTGSAHSSNSKRQEFFRDKTRESHKNIRSQLNIFEKFFYSFKLLLFYLNTKKEKKMKP